MKRATARTGWLAGLAVGMSGGFLALEGPLFGVAVLVAMAALAGLSGQLAAGLGGLLLGVGLVWIGLFGRLKLTCTAASGCEAPMIDAYLGEPRSISSRSAPRISSSTRSFGRPAARFMAIRSSSEATNNRLPNRSRGSAERMRRS